MMISMKIDKIKGDITAEGFKETISVDSVGCELSHAKASCYLECDEDNQPFAEVSIVKKVDSSSAALFECAVNQKVLPKVEIKFLAGGAPMFLCEELNLTNVRVSFHGFEHEDAPEAGRTVEFYSFIPETVERVFIPRDSKNKPGKPVSFKWEVCKPKKVQKAKAAPAPKAKPVKKAKRVK